MIRRTVVFGASFVGVGFLVLPVVAIFARVPPGRLVSQLGNGAVMDALRVSAETSAIAQALVLLVGTPTAVVLARRFPGRGLLVSLVELPLVLPPAVAGIGLFAAFGRLGLLHTSIPFTKLAVVFAVALVSGPLYVRAAIAAFEGVDANVVAASRTLGAGPTRTFFRVVLPLAVYSEFAVPNGFDTALAIGALLVVLSAALLISLKWLPSLSTSRFRFAASS
jgi:molybdate transport system permease protein